MSIAYYFKFILMKYKFQPFFIVLRKVGPPVLDLSEE